jgi:hypothetical protein
MATNVKQIQIDAAMLNLTTALEQCEKVGAPIPQVCSAFAYAMHARGFQAGQDAVAAQQSKETRKVRKWAEAQKAKAAAGGK